MEVNIISDRNNKKARYQRLGKELKKIQDDTEKHVHERLIEGMKEISPPTLLPDDFVIYLLGLKQKVNLPVSVLPSSLFDKPLFFGRKEFFQRLASELISFGLAYQRVFLQPVRLSKIAELFHKHRPWWQCDIQDIEKAIESLVSSSIIQKTEEGFLFEPLTMSSEVQEFLNLINVGINNFGEISLSLLQELVPWKKTKIDAIIDLLCSNGICIFHKEEKILFFPEFKRG
ncbi:MAG: hypothetical protein ACFFAJ_02050 [Candidatus Hodarchaeota archaeon]